MNMSESPKTDPFPARSRKETDIVSLEPGKAVWIAGRIMEGLLLQDMTAAIPLDFKGVKDHGIKIGDLVEVKGQKTSQEGFLVEEWCKLFEGNSLQVKSEANQALWKLPKELYMKRSQMKEGLRGFFYERGFMEVETPILVPAPGQEPHLEPFVTRLNDGSKEGAMRYLITSPEYFHKRLLCAGFEKIFEIARVFRNGVSELRGLHHCEFNMVEWYRAYASYLEIMEDVENLVFALANTGNSPLAHSLKPPYQRISMAEAFKTHAKVDLEPYLDQDPNFALKEAQAGRFGLKEEDPIKTRYFKIFVGGVEPNLGSPLPQILVDFPASEASLSKVRKENPKVCERFELYIHGIELANGFTELNDPQEQARRFQLEAKEREQGGLAPVPVDELFLEALSLGMPPSGGVALGFDRLLMLLFNAKSYAEVVPYILG